MGKPVSQRVSKGLETAPDGRPRPVGYNPGALALLVLAPAYLAYQAFQTPTTVVYRVPVWGWVHWGEWDYSVFLKPNTLYDARELGPGLTYYETLVEGIEARFSYNMTTDAPARIEGWYEITADLAAGELLRERVLVVPRTTFEVTEGSSVSVEQVLPIDREAYRARLEQMAEETGLQAGEDPTVTYTAHVEAEAVAGTGSTRQVLEPNLVVPLTGATFTIEGDRSLKANGVIRRTETRPASGAHPAPLPQAHRRGRSGRAGVARRGGGFRGLHAGPGPYLRGAAQAHHLPRPLGPGGPARFLHRGRRHPVPVHPGRARRRGGFRGLHRGTGPYLPAAAQAHHLQRRSRPARLLHRGRRHPLPACAARAKSPLTPLW
ncbi:MAG: hypothetical protein J4N90_01540 [Chloroflexi bacterium]|nr:hypothetical protein [Chloroflexota bacterium]